MRVGLVLAPGAGQDTNPTDDLGFDVRWRAEATELSRALEAEPVDGVVLTLAGTNTDNVIAAVNDAQRQSPRIKVLLLCGGPDQGRVLAEIIGCYPRPRPNRFSGSGPLTPQQRRVLSCIRAGMTNREISHALGISVSTVNRHVEHVLVRLGVRNRAQAAALGEAEAEGWRGGTPLPKEAVADPTHGR